MRTTICGTKHAYTLLVPRVRAADSRGWPVVVVLVDVAQEPESHAGLGALLQRHGFAVLLVSMAPLRLGQPDMSANSAALVDHCRWLQTRGADGQLAVDTSRIVLLGHGMAGPVAMAASAELFGRPASNAGGVRAAALPSRLAVDPHP